jgi:uncharacterized protein YdaU (DUF1376 family)
MSAGKAPAFMFYASDFAHDQNVELMDVSEVGAYVRLMCSAWTEGSIPSDLKQIARIAKVSPARMIKLWPAIEICWQPLEGDETRLVQKRMERVRAEQQAYREQKVIAGKAGAKAKHYGKQDPPPSSGSAKVSPAANGQHKPGSATISPQAEAWRESGPADFSLVAKSSSSVFGIQSSYSYPDSVVGSECVSDASPALTPARKLTPTTCATNESRSETDESLIGDDELDLPPSSADLIPWHIREFADWWVARGIALGAISDHHDLFPLEFCRQFGGIETSTKYIAKYGIGLVKERSERIFKAAKDGKLAKNPRPSRLVDQWDKPDISGVPNIPCGHVIGEFDTHTPLPKRGFETDKRRAEDVPVIGTPRTKCPACGDSGHTEIDDCAWLKKRLQKNA